MLVLVHLAIGRQRQKDQKFEANPGNMSSCFKGKKNECLKIIRYIPKRIGPSLIIVDKGSY